MGDWPKPSREAPPGWTVENGEFRLRSITLDAAELVLQVLLPEDTLDSVPLPDAWNALLAFATIPASDGDAGLSFQVRMIEEGEPVAEVLILRRLRQGTDPSWPLAGAGYQLVYTAESDGLEECSVFSHDHATARGFVDAVDRSPQFRRLAERSTAAVTVVVEEIE
jgi:hypothetical protein